MDSPDVWLQKFLGQLSGSVGSTTRSIEPSDVLFPDAITTSLSEIRGARFTWPIIFFTRKTVR
jgi:hypothetical protein